MLDDLEKADGWAELTYDEQTERIRTAFDAQWRIDHGIGKDEGTGRAVKKGGNTQCNCLDPNGVFCDEYKVRVCGRQIVHFRKVFHEGKQVGTHRWCAKHGGRSAGTTKDAQGNSSQPCKHPGCGQNTGSGKTRTAENPINKDLQDGNPQVWRYCNSKCKAVDAPRVALFTAIRDKLGKDDTDVQAKLTALNTKQHPGTPAAAIAQLKNILAAGTLQALQDALDAGPSGASGP